MVVTQKFDQMIDQGLFYGYFNEGKAFIFLLICLEDPQTLYYEKFILEDPPTTSSIGPDKKL